VQKDSRKRLTLSNVPEHRINDYRDSRRRHDLRKKKMCMPDGGCSENRADFYAELYKLKNKCVCACFVFLCSMVRVMQLKCFDASGHSRSAGLHVRDRPFRIFRRLMGIAIAGKNDFGSIETVHGSKGTRVRITVDLEQLFMARGYSTVYSQQAETVKPH